MFPVNFRFRPSISADQLASVLAEIHSWQEVTGTGKIYPDSNRADDRLKHFAYVSDHSKLSEIAERISQMPQVESASVPSLRRPMG